MYYKWTLHQGWNSQLSMDIQDDLSWKVIQPHGIPNEKERLAMHVVASYVTS